MQLEIQIAAYDENSNRVIEKEFSELPRIGECIRINTKIYEIKNIIWEFKEMSGIVGMNGIYFPVLIVS